MGLNNRPHGKGDVISMTKAQERSWRVSMEAGNKTSGIWCVSCKKVLRRSMGIEYDSAVCGSCYKKHTKSEIVSDAAAVRMLFHNKDVATTINSFLLAHFGEYLIPFDPKCNPGLHSLLLDLSDIVNGSKIITFFISGWVVIRKESSIPASVASMWVSASNVIVNHFVVSADLEEPLRRFDLESIDRVFPQKMITFCKNNIPMKPISIHISDLILT